VPQVAAATITQIQMFRDYIHYHLKCSSAFASFCLFRSGLGLTSCSCKPAPAEAYLHSRMRSRTTYFLKVLNRAKPEKPEDQVHQKTARCVFFGAVPY
jgi:actin related protein 2/3 complex subunit 2